MAENGPIIVKPTLFPITQRAVRRGVRASDKREPYQIIVNPADADFPAYLAKNQEVWARLDRSKVAILVMATECRNSKGRTLFTWHSVPIPGRHAADWDYNTLDLFIGKVIQIMEFQVAQKGLNLVRFIDPDRVPGKARRGAPLI